MAKGELEKATVIGRPHAKSAVFQSIFVSARISLKVWRRDGKGCISWDKLQEVKNAAFGPDATCIEIYPPQGKVVNELNMRHLWMIPDISLPSLWR
jgi:hypothetical protein